MCRIAFQPSSGGYATEWYTNQLTALTATPVTVSNGGTTSGINAQTITPTQFTIEASYQPEANGGFRTIVDAIAQSVVFP